MTFLLDQVVTWRGEDCVVAVVRDSGLLALTRIRDKFTIITSAAALAAHQPAAAKPARAARRTLLGDLA